MASKKFPGNYSSLKKISDFIAKQAERVDLDEDVLYSVQLAVDEACTNIIEHAYGGEGHGDIVCVCNITPAKVEIELRDKGKPFDPDKTPVPRIDVPLEDLPSRGAGVYLMKKLMDKVDFDFSDSGETRCRMLKLIPEAK